MRATSTVVDATVFLLLVSVAVATLAVPAQDAPATDADDVAETLASTTTSVSYDHGIAGRQTARSATGTHAGLLGRAALGNLTLDGASLTPGSGDFERAVRNATATVLDRKQAATQVEVRWSPYPGAPLRGSVTIGQDPPPGVDVSVATVTVPVPVADVSEAAVNASDDGYRQVANLVASSVVAVTLPRDEVERGVPGSAARRTARVRRSAFADALDTEAVVTSMDGELANPKDRLQAALAARLAADMRERFDSPSAAARALQTGHARLVVREWEP